MGSPHIALTILGGGQEIGANCYLLEWGRYRLLLDCGFDLKRSGYDALPLFEILGERQVDALIISHAHIDHCGSLPVVMEHFLRGGSHVFMTPPTEALLPLMLIDSARIQEYNRQSSPDLHDFPWFLTQQRVATLCASPKAFVSRMFHDQFELLPGLTAQFFPAGHILGAAGVVLSDGTYTLVYSGDICVHEQTLHYGSVLPNGLTADCVICESTRGSIETIPTVNRGTEIVRLAKEIRDTLQRGGHVLMPSFALGRTQDLVLTLALLKDEGKIPRNTPVLYHHGLTTKINEIYRRFLDYLKPEAQGLHHYCRSINGFDSDDGFKRSRKLTPVPSIFVFTGGMLTRGTPAAHLASELVRSEKHSILFTGYLDPEELGYELAYATVGDKLCFGLDACDSVEIRCPHRHRFSLSSHADRDALITVAEHFEPNIVVWVHGDPAATEWLRKTFSVRNPKARSIGPVNGETIVLRD